MLEALVSLRRGGGNGPIASAEKITKKAGDILVVQKSPAVWSIEEMRFFLIVKLKDDALEGRMVDRVLSYPYAKYEDGKMINRSTRKFDYKKLPGDSPGLNSGIVSGPIDVGKKKHVELSDLKLLTAVGII